MTRKDAELVVFNAMVDLQRVTGAQRIGVKVRVYDHPDKPFTWDWEYTYPRKAGVYPKRKEIMHLGGRVKL